MTNAVHRLAAVAIASVIAAGGCSGSPYPVAPVSGVITLDDKPLAGARVGFEPQRKGQQALVGPGSYGTTDDDGRFTLATADGRAGAVIGPHRVSISTSVSAADRSSQQSREVTPERVPLHYLDGRAVITFEVPPAGTAAANFALSSAPP